MSVSSTPSQSVNDAHFRQETRQGFDADIAEASSEEDKLGLLTSIQSFAFHFINDASRRPPAESAAVQLNLDVLWYMFLETAKILAPNDPIQDSLVLLLLCTKELNVLHTSLHPTGTVMPTSELYHFAESVQASWEQLLRNGTASQQSNLAAFSAKILAVGICQDLLSRTALWFLREVLEEEDEAKAIAQMHVHSQIRSFTYLHIHSSNFRNITTSFLSHFYLLSTVHKPQIGRIIIR